MTLLLSLLLGCAPKQAPPAPPDPCPEYEARAQEDHVGPERQLEFLLDVLSREARPALREELLLRMGRLSQEQASCAVRWATPGGEGWEERQEERARWSRRAVYAYRRLLSENPASPRADEALYGLGGALAAQGRGEEARAAWALLLEQHPESPLRPSVLADLSRLSPEIAPPP